jgi:hypothetical protein
MGERERRKVERAPHSKLVIVSITTTQTHFSVVVWFPVNVLMKLTLRPAWRLWPLASFLGLLDLKTGVTIALLFAVRVVWDWFCVQFISVQYLHSC